MMLVLCVYVCNPYVKVKVSFRLFKVVSLCACSLKTSCCTSNKIWQVACRILKLL